MPYGERSPQASRCIRKAIRSTSHAGELSLARARSGVGTPRNLGGMMFTGVRNDTRTRAAPSTSRVAISVPVLPAPTTSTSLPR